MLPESIELEQDGTHVVIRMGQEELAHHHLQEAVDEALDRMRYDNAQHFIFDMTGVNFMASACVGVLVSMLQEVEHRRGRIALANCGDNVSFLFKVTKLDTVFGIHDELEDAMAAL